MELQRTRQLSHTQYMFLVKSLLKDWESYRSNNNVITVGCRAIMLFKSFFLKKHSHQPPSLLIISPTWWKEVQTCGQTVGGVAAVSAPFKGTVCCNAAEAALQIYHIRIMQEHSSVLLTVLEFRPNSSGASLKGKCTLWSSSFSWHLYY